MKQFLEDFSRTIQEAEKQLIAIPENTAAAGAPGKWSSKQIVGHLIDSAANHHLRFVRAQTTNDLVCSGYDQEAWVNAQRYDQESWANLVQLWSAYNRHLLHFISAMPDDALKRDRQEHNLDQVAFKSVSTNTSTTLEYFVRDYVDHLVHHLNQILVARPEN
jgi:hypothetical protein